jgi:hypothetical protein
VSPDWKLLGASKLFLALSLASHEKLFNTCGALKAEQTEYVAEAAERFL